MTTTEAVGLSASPYPRIKALGITEFTSSVTSDEIVADICFVHGLGGHPRKTWQYGKDTKPEKDHKKSRFSFLRRNKDGKSSSRQAAGSSRSSSIGSSARQSSQTATAPENVEVSSHNGSDSAVTMQSQSCYWPFDLVSKDFPNTRILIYGYDSNPSHFYKSSTNQMTISQHSRQLLLRVTDARTECRKRPIIFVAHSLGGILVKDAIVESEKPDQRDDARDTGVSCVAVMFFGTPHVGADMATLGRVVSNIVQIIPGGISTYSKILRGLEPDSEKLEQVLLDFNGFLERQVKTDDPLQIYSFREGLGYSSLAYFDGKVVPDYSSWFGRRMIEKASFVQENHMNMCKLALTNDKVAVTYRDDFVRAMREYLARTAAKDQEQRIESVQRILDSLDFTGRMNREVQLSELLVKPVSFDWLWDSAFASWLKTPDERFFWVRGDAASGKSTLMLHITENQKTMDALSSGFTTAWIRIYHFFDFRAKDRLANNFNGALRSLIIQMVERAPKIFSKSEVLADLCDASPSRHDATLRQLSMKSCQHALLAALDECNMNVLILLDGLDEYTGEMSSLINLLEALAAKVNIKLCVASRPVNELIIAFDHKPRLLMHDVNRPGIAAFARESFGDLLRISKSITERDVINITDEIADRSEGMFLWAKFAVERVLGSSSQGLPLNSTILRERLQAVPENLTSIYADMISKIPSDLRYIGALVTSLNAHAEEDLPVTLLHAVLQNIPETTGAIAEVVQLAKSIDRNEDFERLLRASTGGLCSLTEATVSELKIRRPRCLRLIHRSVEAFLLDHGWECPGWDHKDDVFVVELWLRTLVEHLSKHPRYLQTHLEKSAARSGDVRNDSEEASLILKQEYALEPGLVIQDLQPPLLNYSIRHVFAHAAKFEQHSSSSSLLIMKKIMSAPLARDHRASNGACACDFLHVLSSYRVLARRMHEATDTPPSALQSAIGHELHRYLHDYVREDPEGIEMDWGKAIDPEAAQVAAALKNVVGLNHGLCSTLTRGEAALLWALAHVTPPYTYVGQARCLDVALEFNSNFSNEQLFDAIIRSNTAVIRKLLRIRKPDEFTVMTYDDGRLLNRWVSHVLLLPSSSTMKFRLLWGVGRRFAGGREAIEGIPAIIRLLKAAGEDFNAECGPFGTVLHSLIDSLDIFSLTTKEVMTTFENFIHLLQQEGLNIHQTGCYGNALDFAWLLYGKRNGVYCPVFEFLIDAGLTFTRSGPDGKLPSVDEVLKTRAPLTGR